MANGVSGIILLFALASVFTISSVLMSQEPHQKAYGQEFTSIPFQLGNEEHQVIAIPISADQKLEGTVRFVISNDTPCSEDYRNKISIWEIRGGGIRNLIQATTDPDLLGDFDPISSRWTHHLEFDNFSVEAENQNVPFVLLFYNKCPQKEVQFTYSITNTMEEPTGGSGGTGSTGGGETNGTPPPCLIATASYGSPMAHEVQLLREIRDNQLLKTESGSAFMHSFNSIYYTFAPTIANWEDENPTFKEIVKITITPLISSLSLLQLVEMDSEVEVLVYGISMILLNVGMYVVAPVGIGLFVIRKTKNS